MALECHAGVPAERNCVATCEAITNNQVVDFIERVYGGCSVRNCFTVVQQHNMPGDRACERVTSFY